jgi:hypothetical protein
MKKYALLSLIFLNCVKLFPQFTGKFVYDNPASSQWEFYAKKIKPCADGGALYIHQVSGVNSFLLIKTDSLFAMQWAQEILTLPSTAFIQDIGEIPSGGYYVYASDNNNSSSGTEAEYLIKLSQSGSLAWSKQYDVPFSGMYAGSSIKFFPTGEFLMMISTYGYAGYIVIDPNGNVLQGEGIIADASSSKNPGFDAVIVNDSIFVAIMKTTSDNYFFSMSKTGNLQWAKRYTVSSPFVYHQPRAIRKMSDSNLVVSGMYSDSVNATGFLLKMDLNGNILWRKLYSSALFSGLSLDGIAEKANGNILLKDYYNTLVLETTANGNVVTGRIVDGNNIELGLASPKMVFACNRFDVTAGTFVPGLYKNADDLDNECALINYNGVVASNPPYTPVITNPITRFVIPSSSGDGNVLVYPSNYTYTLADACPGVGMHEYTATDILLLYPDPANDVINISVTSPSAIAGCTIQLCDLNGRILISEKPELNSGSIQLPVSRFSNGVYAVRFVSEGKIRATKKLIIAR